MGFWGTRDPSIEAHEAISHPWPAGGGRGRGDRCWGGRKKIKRSRGPTSAPKGSSGTFHSTQSMQFHPTNTLGTFVARLGTRSATFWRITLLIFFSLQYNQFPWFLYHNINSESYVTPVSSGWKTVLIIILGLSAKRLEKCKHVTKYTVPGVINVIPR